MTTLCFRHHELHYSLALGAMGFRQSAAPSAPWTPPALTGAERLRVELDAADRVTDALFNGFGHD